MRTLRRGASIRSTQDRVASGKVSTLSIQMGSRCRLLAQATGVEDKYRLIGILPDASKKGSHGLSFLAGYTYSHALDDASNNDSDNFLRPNSSQPSTGIYGN